MSYAPQSLVELGSYWTSKGGVNLGIVGNAAHVKGYHLGRDRIFSINGQGWQDYSVQLPLDKPYLTDAASAIDLGRLGGTLKGLQDFSNWFVEQCKAGAPGTEEVREFIWSPDGELPIHRWSHPDQRVYTGRGNGDASHRTHSHLSRYRRYQNSRGLIAAFRPYFEVEERMLTITRVKCEDWTAVPETGAPVRDDADRSGAAIIARIPVGALVRTIAEASTTPDGNNWRLTELPDGRIGWLLRIDLAPVTPGGDPALDAQLSDLIARKPPSTITVQGHGLVISGP